jgi:hypothetical protein
MKIKAWFRLKKYFFGISFYDRSGKEIFHFDLSYLFKNRRSLWIE